jgi:hypothetical protein
MEGTGVNSLSSSFFDKTSELGREGTMNGTK